MTPPGTFMRARHGELMPTTREPKPLWNDVPSEVKRALAAAIGSEVVQARVVFGGYSSSATFALTCVDGTRAFVKGARPQHNHFIRSALAAEARVYSEFPAVRPFAPKFFQAVEATGWHFLVMEDLTDADRAPPWSDTKLTAVLQQLVAFHNARAAAPAWVVDIAEELGKANWASLATEAGAIPSFCQLFADPRAAREWLDVSLPRLLESDKSFPPWTDRPVVLHFDVRSDNILFRPDGGQVVFLDWNWLHTGSALIDVAFFAVGVAGECGPLPREIVAEYEKHAGIKFSDDEITACAVGVSGLFASRAHRPDMEDLPRLRWAQRLQLFPALEWAVERLGLPAMPLVRNF